MPWSPDMQFNIAPTPVPTPVPAQEKALPEKRSKTIVDDSFASGKNNFGGYAYSKTVKEVAEMPGHVFRADFADGDKLELVQELKLLPDEQSQRNFLEDKIKRRRRVFEELRDRGIAVPQFKSKIVQEGDRLNSFTLVEKVEGLTPGLDAISDEMVSAFVDVYSKLADYYLDKCKNLEWDAILNDIKTQQFVYGAIGDEPKKMYLVDIGMESVTFYKPLEGYDPSYQKTNSAHYKLEQILDSIKFLKKEITKNTPLAEREQKVALLVELDRKVENVYEETGDIMMTYSTSIFNI